MTSRLADPDTLAAVIVVTRFRVPQAEQAAFRGDLERARQTLAGQRGYVAGRIGRNVDDPELWVLTTEWEGPGAYRRALDEPSAYERVEPGEALNDPRSRSLG